jgi:hypothetical protein
MTRQGQSRKEERRRKKETPEASRPTGFSHRTSILGCADGVLGSQPGAHQARREEHVGLLRGDSSGKYVEAGGCRNRWARSLDSGSRQMGRSEILPSRVTLITGAFLRASSTFVDKEVGGVFQPDRSRKMDSIKKRFAKVVEGCSEGQRWNGRTQCYSSRSPEQLHHDRTHGRRHLLE